MRKYSILTWSILLLGALSWATLSNGENIDETVDTVTDDYKDEDKTGKGIIPDDHTEDDDDDDDDDGEGCRDEFDDFEDDDEYFDEEDDEEDYEDDNDDDCKDEDDDESDKEHDKDSDRHKRQSVGVPGVLPPPSTYSQRKRVIFDNSINIDSESNPSARNATDGGLNFRVSSLDDEDSSDWSVVTRTGYEYQAKNSALKSIFRSARLTAANGGITYSGNPISDGDITPVGVDGPPGVAGPSKRSVYPPDTRKRVFNTNRFPYSAIGRFDNGCTGFFVGPRHILTAGHCVYNFKRKRWYRNLNFGRKKNCDPHRGVRYIWKYAITVKGWKKYGWASYDYAMVVVTRSSPSRMRFGWRKPIPKWTINIAGYPVDKKHPSNCVWRTHCKIRRRYSKRLGYKCDTYHGMSGSPVYAYWRRNNRRIVYCIHAHGVRRPTIFNHNKCVRITKARFKQFNQWINIY